MIKADHKKWAKFVFEIYLERLLKKSFHDFRIVNEIPQIDNTKALLITPNHFSWWDGFFIYWLNKKILKRKLHIMMLEEQLRRYWFFQKLGCYSVDLTDKRKMITSLKYSVDLLSEPGNLVTIYPQGHIQPFDTSNMELKEGINFLGKQSSKDFTVLPVAFKIEYTNEKLPAIYCRFGKPIISRQAANFPQLFKDEFIINLNLLKENIPALNYKSLFVK